MATNEFARVSLTNNAPGPRGVHAANGYIEMAPGQTLPLEMVPAELRSAEEMGCFTIVGGGDQAPAAIAAAPPPGAPAAASGDADTLPSNIMQLRRIARDEGVELGGATNVADTKAAIVAARAAKAPQEHDQGDQLDGMDDETLRNTVAAITGKPVAELGSLDRAALLALARGE